jgi:hypothetical protein
MLHEYPKNGEVPQTPGVYPKIYDFVKGNIEAKTGEIS